MQLYYAALVCRGDNAAPRRGARTRNSHRIILLVVRRSDSGQASCVAGQSGRADVATESHGSGGIVRSGRSGPEGTWEV